MRLKLKISLSLFLFAVLAYISSSFLWKKPIVIEESDKVLDVLWQLHDEMPEDYINIGNLNTQLINQGKNLVTTGFLNPNSKNKDKKQSKHFVCTDCHNIQREDPDLTKSHPENRLDYVVKNKIKFLPATTLYGTINKNHWYNGDYSKKYGELVEPARDTLKNAIQLCAVVCSQGRLLNKNELEAVILFLNDRSYRIKDLNLLENEKQHIAEAISSGNTKKQKEAIKLIKSKYLDYSPATFMKPQEIDNRSFGIKGNPETGKQIFELSCLTCHKEGGVTNYKLHDDKLTHKHLKYWANTHKVFSVYDITRKGTYSKNGYKPYMPNYTKQRLSDQQLEDLMAYINEMAENGKI